MAGRKTDDYRAAIRKSDLPATSRLVAIVMSEFMDHRTLADARPGAALVSRQTGLGISTVREHLALLVDAGWLEITSPGGFPRKAAVYRGRIPDRHTSSSRNYSSRTRPDAGGTYLQLLDPTPLKGEDQGGALRPTPEGSAPAPAKKSGVVNLKTLEIE